MNIMTDDYQQSLFKDAKPEIIVKRVRAQFNWVLNYCTDPETLNEVMSQKFGKEAKLTCRIHRKDDVNFRSTVQNDEFFFEIPVHPEDLMLQSCAPNSSGLDMGTDYTKINSNVNNPTFAFYAKILSNVKYENYQSFLFRLVKIQSPNSLESMKGQDINLSEFKDNFIDIRHFFHEDIDDCSCVIILELYSNMHKKIIERLYEFLDKFYTNLKNTLENAVNICLVSGSILVNKNLNSLLGFLYSTKLFNSRIYKIYNVERDKNYCEITVICYYSEQNLIRVEEKNQEGKDIIRIRVLSDNLCYLQIDKIFSNEFQKNLKNFSELNKIMGCFLKRLKKNVETK